MKNLIFALCGLIMATSVDACQQRNPPVQANSSSQSSCGAYSEVMASDKPSADVSSLTAEINKIIEDLSKKEGSRNFSLPSIDNLKLEEYSIAGMDFIRVKLISGAEISFPKNGYQMSSEAVVKLSEANRENDSLLTRFYMAMFGLSKWEGKYLEMGFDKDNLACKIFSVTGEDRKEFKNNFKKIASNSVGRTLLYRLLIEIRRTDGGNGNGYTDGILDKALETDELQERNNCRRLTIIASAKIRGNSFNSQRGSIKFSPSNDKRETCVFGSEKTGEIEIIRASRPDDVGLFHELLHWFHLLRDLQRKNEETQILTGTNNEKLLISRTPMGSENIKLWIQREDPDDPDSELLVKMEEFRTIMGYTVNFLININGKRYSYTPKYIFNGDDLSENLYRLCIGQPLRYGHITRSKPTSILSVAGEEAQKSCNKAINAGGYKIN